MIAATVAAPLLGGSIHAAPADAAPMPTISVTLAGDSDWQITYHRGSATHHDARCRVWMDRQVVASFEQAAPHSAPPMLGTTTLRGYAVAAGAHQVNVLRPVGEPDDMADRPTQPDFRRRDLAVQRHRGDHRLLSTASTWTL